MFLFVESIFKSVVVQDMGTSHGCSVGRGQGVSTPHPAKGPLFSTKLHPLCIALHGGVYYNTLKLSLATSALAIKKPLR